MNKILLISFLFLVACGGGGGGGGGASSPTISDPGLGDSGPTPDPEDSPVEILAVADDFRTTEYNNQWGLEAIKSADAYALLTNNDLISNGEGVVVAVLDSGIQISHTDLDANTGGVAHANNLLESTLHGTHVAGTIAAEKNNIGMHGVAYGSKISAIKVIGALVPVLSTEIGIEFAAGQNAKIANMSWRISNAGATVYTNIGSAEYNIFKNILNEDFQIAKDNDILMVIASGNDGLTDFVSLPALYAQDADYKDYMIAVGSIDIDGAISEFSNNCKQVKNDCLVAPGGLIYATAPANSYEYLSGTSMATPHVSGAAAILRAAWPHLTALQVKQILLNSAQDIGAAGVDDVYGHGLLDLYEAAQPSGIEGLSYSNKVLDAKYSITNSSLISDPIFGDAFTNRLSQFLEKAVYFDDYGRNYKSSLANKIEIRGRNSLSLNINNLLLNNYQNNIIPFSFNASVLGSRLISAKIQFRSYSENYKKFLTIDRSQEDLALDKGQGFSLSQNINKNLTFGFSYNIDELQNSDKFNNFGFISQNNGYAANPYQSFVSGSSSSQIKNFNQFFLAKNIWDKKLQLNLSYQTSYRGSSLLAGSDNKQNQISDLNFLYKPTNSTNFAISFGNMKEFNNNFLNSQSLGAFESPSDVKTSYTKFSLNQYLFNDIYVLASYSQGSTQIKGNQYGLFRDFSDIKSRAMSFGLASHDFAGGEAGIIYNEPLRIYAGSVQVDAAIARDNSGNVTRAVENIDLRPSGKEKNFEIFYARKIGYFSQISLNFVITKNVRNLKSQDSSLAVLRYKLDF